MGCYRLDSVDEFAAELKKTRSFIGAGRKLYKGE
jgi:hypothetical protein